MATWFAMPRGGPSSAQWVQCNTQTESYGEVPNSLKISYPMPRTIELPRKRNRWARDSRMQSYLWRYMEHAVRKIIFFRISHVDICRPCTIISTQKMLETCWKFWLNANTCVVSCSFIRGEVPTWSPQRRLRPSCDSDEGSRSPWLPQIGSKR